MSDPAPAPTPTPAPASGTLSADPAWANFDADTRGFFTNKGLEAKTPVEAAAALAKSYREAEKFLHAPPEQIARIPKDANDDAGWRALYTRLGAPAEAKDYEFKDIKFADGTELDEEFTSAMRNAFHTKGVSKDAAADIVRAFVKFNDAFEERINLGEQAKAKQEYDDLMKSWGSNKEAFQFIANQAAEKLGLGKDVLDALSKVSGRVAATQALVKLGQMMGEDKFVNSPGGQKGNLMTREQAQAKLNSLKSDDAWARKIDSGDTAANAELHALTRIIAQAA